MIGISGVMISAALIIGVMEVFARRGSTHSPTRSIWKFICRLREDLSIVGVIGLGFCIVCYVLTSYAGELEPVSSVVWYLLIIIGLFLLLAPIKGFWEVDITGNDILVRHLWILKSKYTFNEIHHCRMMRDGLEVYIKRNAGKHSKKKYHITKAFLIDANATCFKNFIRRCEFENIKIVYMFPSKRQRERQKAAKKGA